MLYPNMFEPNFESFSFNQFKFSKGMLYYCILGNKIFVLLFCRMSNGDLQKRLIIKIID